MIEQHYTVADVATRLRRSRGWVLRAIEHGKLRAMKLSSPDARGVTQRPRILIPESSVREMIGESPAVPARRADQARARRACFGLGLDPEHCGRLGAED